MSNETELIQHQMEKTRGSLTEKLEALEGQVVDTVSSTTGAVQDTTQAVQETVTGAVDAVKETVATVSDKVHETVQTVSDTFNLRLQMERHPWLVLGGAVAVGYCLESTFGSRSQAAAPMAANAPPPPPPPWNGASQKASEHAQSETQEPSAWSDAFSHLKDIGVSYLMALVRDLAKQGLPGDVGSRVANEVDALTTKLGTEPISGPVLPEQASTGFEEDRSRRTEPDYDEKRSSYRGRSPVTAY
jgi:hypothetical protein